MDSTLFLKALVIGLSIAAPVGPIGLLCIQRTLAHGRTIGFLSGLGAALADACYGAIGALGVSAVIASMVAARVPLALAGAAFLAWMGVQLLRAPVATQARQAADATTPLKATLSVFLLTLANPMTILSFVAVFATISTGHAGGSGGIPAATMVLGVFLGSALWWLGLSTMVSSVRHKLSAKTMQSINRLSGAILLAFAVYQLSTLLPR
ncbi:LysE family transporter [Variovorax sp. NFACC27]|uniref:LysE/ArgO family amino acid transporter n=1 Tax=unclassified Variovorax TaxID=663243 RepID=UPI000896B863|nr:Threonine/homoserine/homoserine lactone efflux protein [Variovorax sp. NFACC28]SEG25430.1 Threonine/homoserine/homoserine lactone efflux protein [Variovorax sp. NFACC29]SFC46751.1 Threonine/homoserine/homoserine lactone efflux protein [Variovorax sp. NFACC26]SFF92349.1 Threonine/homoserine/homoserine lactone efflux protein [Variovorax sp. NFACC27]